MSGQPAIVGSIDHKGIWGMTDTEAQYIPGSRHWEAGKAYVYAGAQVTLLKGAPCMKTGADGDELECHCTTATSGAPVVGIAVSDITAGSYGWLQIYGPMTSVLMESGLTTLANSYIITGDNSSYGVVNQLESVTGTGGGGICGYCLIEAASATTEIQAYICNLIQLEGFSGRKAGTGWGSP